MSAPIAFIWMVNTNQRLVGIEATLHFLSQSKHKDRIDLWVAASTAELVTEIQKVAAQSPYNIRIQYVNVNDDSWHGYKKKLAAILPKYQYFVKCDDDLFYSQYVLDHLVESVDVLDNPDIMWVFPTSSINSLTTDAFITDFVTDDAVRQAIYQDFTSFDYQQYPNHNGTDDLMPLKEFFHTMGPWNPEALRQYMLSAHYFNGGEHPIRHSNPAITKLNTYIIDHIGRIFAPHELELEPVKGFYQGQMYLMRSDMWFQIQQLVDAGVLRRGLIDETEINWYIKYHGKTALRMKNSFVIHPALQGVNLNYYHQMIYNAIRRYIGV